MKYNKITTETDATVRTNKNASLNVSNTTVLMLVSGILAMFALFSDGNFESLEKTFKAYIAITLISLIPEALMIFVVTLGECNHVFLIIIKEYTKGCT